MIQGFSKVTVNSYIESAPGGDCPCGNEVLEEVDKFKRTKIIAGE